MKSNAKIAIIGLGRAGQARHRSFSKLFGDKLIVLSSRRQSQSPQFEEIRTDPDIAAVVLSRESQRHAIDAQAMLARCSHLVHKNVRKAVFDAHTRLARSDDVRMH